MKANELMIGDLLLHKGQPIKVEEILIDGINPMWDGCENYGNEAYYEDLQPIHLTPEILKKNGYRNSVIVDDYFIAHGVHYNMDSKCIMFGHEYGSVLEVRCEYVHELQHALRLCGIDKEIVL